MSGMWATLYWLVRYVTARAAIHMYAYVARARSVILTQLDKLCVFVVFVNDMYVVLHFYEKMLSFQAISRFYP